MRLIHQGRVMRDGTPVSDYPVQDNQFLHLVVREEAPAAPAASSSAAGAAAPQAAEQQQQQPHFHQPQVHTFTTQGSGTDLAGALSVCIFFFFALFFEDTIFNNFFLYRRA